MRALATAGPHAIACAGAGVKYFGWDKLLSLPTFFAAAKKVGAAPHRGNANRPTRNWDPAKKAQENPCRPHRGNANRPTRKWDPAKKAQETPAAPHRGNANKPTRKWDPAK